MGKTITEKLDEILDIDPVETTEIVEVKQAEIVPLEKPSESFLRNQDVLDDYDKSREILHDVLDKGAMALDRLIDLADDSERPTAYDSIGSLIKNIVDAQKATMDLHKVVKDIGDVQEAETPQPQIVNNTQNQVFVGSTKDLQEMMEDEEDEENEELDG